MEHLELLVLGHETGDITKMVWLDWVLVWAVGRILGKAGLTGSTSSWLSSIESGYFRGELIGTIAQGTPLITGWPKQP
jgi:hypothetical protein